MALTSTIPPGPSGAPSPSFIPSSSFVIVCACLVIDINTHDALLTRGLRSPIPTVAAGEATVRIPRGPKRIDEGLLSAAVRQTLEATGFRAVPLRAPVPTRAAPQDWGTDADVRVRSGVAVVHGAGAGGGGGWVADSYEPFAACEFTDEAGVREIVFYFLATVDGKVPSAQGRQPGQDAVWASVGDVEAGLLGLSEEEHMVVRTGVEIAKAKIGAS
ncbi:uncharacterized protein DNG_06442 [Cephalotrichum gorgonifer]|uniref:Nudix hydrolase domain-containing protein n=1 Tax=Cephalotrichum gorgonifer TaxID=2041049 RepID=A0AAE8N1N6_9PEZI|nr:uncharacterized protein DNG_06442 [Cephalotrichum gorgonifer]